MLVVTAFMILLSLLFLLKAFRAQRLAPFIEEQRLRLPIYGVLSGLSSAITVGLIIACIFFGV